MAHYAFLDDNSIVTEIIVGNDEGEDDIDWEQHYGAFREQPCKRTSYNTHGGVHTSGGTPYRMNYAGIGFAYDAARDAFIPPQSYPSWVLNDSTCQWEPPVPMPDDGQLYQWDEEQGQWVAIPEEPVPLERARNADGTYVADDPSTPDVDEAWEPAA
jgi:hypothetical protein